MNLRVNLGSLLNKNQVAEGIQLRKFKILEAPKKVEPVWLPGELFALRFFSGYIRLLKSECDWLGLKVQELDDHR